MSRTRAEVIQEWVDFDAAGSSFERGRMEANIQSICFKDPAGAPESLRNMHHGVKVKAPAVAFLTQELLVAPHVAEAALVAAGGDKDVAMNKLLRSASV